MRPKVTLGVCVRNSEKIVLQALNSILDQSFPHEMMQLVIVEDGSSDRTFEVARDFVSSIDIEVCLLRTGGKGLAFARQLVVDSAEGEYVVYVDGDQQLPRDFISNHVKFMTNNLNIAAASGSEIFRGGTLVALLESMNISYGNRLSKTSNDVGGGIFRLEALEQVGGFDTRLKGAGEDVEVTIRMKKAGMIIARDNADFYHNHRTSWNALWKEYAWWGYGMHYVNHKQTHGVFPARRMPFLALVFGLQLSLPIYKTFRKKEAFFLPFHSFFKNLAFCVGYLDSHISGHGHR